MNSHRQRGDQAGQVDAAADEYDEEELSVAPVSGLAKAMTREMVVAAKASSTSTRIRRTKVITFPKVRLETSAGKVVSCSPNLRSLKWRNRRVKAEPRCLRSVERRRELGHICGRHSIYVIFSATDGPPTQSQRLHTQEVMG